jgi:uncharacterized membrane protein SirB2
MTQPDLHATKRHWLLRPGSIRALWLLFIAVLVVTVLAEFFVAREAHFQAERWIGFYALYGFLACAVLIIGAKTLGLALKRPDTYYATDDEI